MIYLILLLTFIYPENVPFSEVIRKVANEAKRATVNISAVQIWEEEEPIYRFFFGDPFEEFFFGPDFFDFPRRKRRFKTEATGSGFIISEDGYVLTNEHVIRGAQEIKVTLREGGKDKSYDAEIVGKDHETDVAVIKIKAKRKFPYLELGDSDKIQVGDWVVAIGSPFGLEQTVTCGIISAIRQKVVIEDKVFENMIQTDAAINRGNSGGPLVDLNGKVIGINTAIYAPTGVFAGIGFAIPINLAKDILDDLISKGKVERGWLGVYIQDVDEVIAKQFGLKEVKGALVNKVVPNSPAEKGGVKRGDIILEVDGKEVKDSLSLKRLISGKEPGEKVKLKVLREKRIINLKIKLGRRGKEVKERFVERGRKEVEWKGIVVSNLNEELRRFFSIPDDVDGVVVIRIKEGSFGEMAGLLKGDLIRGINQREISDIEDFKEVTKRIDTKEGVVFDIIRRGEPLYLSVIGE
ncbi:MAG: hypothetical protein DRI36_05415 [Caldiserica bacterium]|nr:MAG: hypothetical protein DRI36_05415 [Caldisericota bacterium]